MSTDLRPAIAAALAKSQRESVLRTGVRTDEIGEVWHQYADALKRTGLSLDRYGVRAVKQGQLHAIVLVDRTLPKGQYVGTIVQESE